MNEDDLLTAIAGLTGAPGSRVLIGIGDDAAVWQPSRSARSVITTDALVSGVHFSLDWMLPEDVGARAMAANLSDIAAMGATPLLATVALGIPEAFPAGDVLACYRGIIELARAAGVTIAGGDLTRSSVLMLSITLVGEVRASNVKRRAGARPHDVLAVTGALGASRAGLMHLQGKLTLEGTDAEVAVQAFRRPPARGAFGRFLGASRNVHAMMDCSDGLSTDLGRLTRASRVGAVVETVPVARAAAAAARLLGVDPDAFALAGGEDFELLIAVAPRAFEHLAARFQTRFGTPLLRIGRIEADERVVVVKQGVEEPLERSGWDHFR